MARLKRAVLELENQINNLPADSPDLPQPNNPAYINLDLQLKSLDIELAALQRSKRDLQSETTELDQAIQVAPEVERQYMELTRDLDIARQQYQDTMAQAHGRRTSRVVGGKRAL